MFKIKNYVCCIFYNKILRKSRKILTTYGNGSKMVFVDYRENL